MSDVMRVEGLHDLPARTELTVGEWYKFTARGAKVKEISWQDKETGDQVTAKIISMSLIPRDDAGDSMSDRKPINTSLFMPDRDRESEEYFEMTSRNLKSALVSLDVEIDNEGSFVVSDINGAEVELQVVLQKREKGDRLDVRWPEFTDEG